MSTPRNIVKNIRSAVVVDGQPKLPTSSQLSEGEIAVNYAKGYETLSFKNNSNEIVSLSVKTVNDVTVNGSSVVSGKTANITMKGATIPVADTYTTTSYPSPFDEGAEHIAPTDKVNEALKKVETNISKLVTEVIDNEDVASEAIAKLAESAGTVDGEKNIKYKQETDTHYIKNAVSVHDATVKLDNNVYSLGTDVASLRSEVTTIGGNVTNIQNSVTSIQTNVTNIQTSVTNIEGNIHSLQVTDGQFFNRIMALENIIKGMDSTEWVDLGLPSGTFWAKCNLGATSETAYGNYYMWGSTTPNTAEECIWQNAPFNGGNPEYNAEAFNKVKGTVCPNDILAKGYDAAYKATNGTARMPTKADFQELIDNTTKEWTQMSSVNGYKFTSKTDTSKYIFIPAAGNCDNGSVNNVGGNGYVWSSSLYASYPNYAWGLYFDSGGCNMGNDYRFYGWSVRGVRNLPL